MGVFFKFLAEKDSDPETIIQAFKNENNGDINAIDISGQTLLHWMIKFRRYDVLSVFLSSDNMLNYNNLQMEDANGETIYTLLSGHFDFLTSEKQFIEIVFFSNQSTKNKKSYKNQILDKNFLSAIELLFSKMFFPDNHNQAILALFRDSKIFAEQFIEEFAKIQPDIHADISFFQENLLFVSLKMKRYRIARQLLDTVKSSTFSENKKIENFKFVVKWIKKFNLNSSNMPVIQKIIKTLTLPYLIKQMLIEEIISETYDKYFVGDLLKVLFCTVNEPIGIGYEIEFSNGDKQKIKDNVRYNTESDVKEKWELLFYLLKKKDVDFIEDIVAVDIKILFRLFVSFSVKENSEYIINWLYSKGISQQEIAKHILLLLDRTSLECPNWCKNHITFKDVFAEYSDGVANWINLQKYKQLIQDCLLYTQKVLAKNYLSESANEFFENGVKFLQFFHFDSDIAFFTKMAINFSNENLAIKIQYLMGYLEFLNSYIQTINNSQSPSKTILETLYLLQNQIRFEMASMFYVGDIELTNGSEQTSIQKGSVTLTEKEIEMAKNTVLLNRAIQAYQFLINNNLEEAKKLKLRFDNILAGNFKWVELDKSSVWTDEACKIFYEFYFESGGLVVSHLPQELLGKEYMKQLGLNMSGKKFTEPLKQIFENQKPILKKTTSLSLLFKQLSDNTPASVDATNLPDNETNAPLFRSNSF